MLQDTKDIMKEKRKHKVRHSTSLKCPPQYLRVSVWFNYFTYCEQKKKDDNLNRRNLNPRKIKTRKEEWERLKMGKEFVVPKNDATG